MSSTPTHGEHAAKLQAAQLQAIHELRGEPGDQGWRAAGVLAAAHAVSRLGPMPGSDRWQPTGDEALCFFVDLLELGGSVSVWFPKETLAAFSATELVAMLKTTARGLLAVPC